MMNHFKRRKSLKMRVLWYKKRRSKNIEQAGRKRKQYRTENNTSPQGNTTQRRFSS